VRIGINTWFINQPTTGSGQYVRQLLWAFSLLSPEDLFLLCGPQPVALLPNQQGIPLFARGDVGKVWFEQVGAPLALRRSRVDVIHYPYFAAPLISQAPLVVTVHDLIPLMREYSGSAKVRAYTRLAETSVSRAEVVITDSIASKVDICQRMQIPEHRVRVVYLGVDSRYFAGRDAPSAAAVRQRYGLRRDFIFYLGGLDGRKNIGVLLRAYSLAREQLSDPPDLVIAGPHPENTQYPAVARHLGLETAVRFVGAVDEADKSTLYSLASLFVFPSLYEGFGLPPLEAMASGTPVVCSNASSLPEVVGDAGILVDPRNEIAIAEAMCEVIESDEVTTRLRSQGLARAAQFTWESTARQTLDIYREAAGR
jgi:glycosyltransferase involved in cell wall biosynthesis